MTPKLWGYLGIGVFLLVLVGFIGCQANKLVKTGEKLGKAEAVEKDLREKLKEERDAHNAEIDSYSTLIENCRADLQAELDLSVLYREEIDRLKLRPPKEVIIEIESTDLLEGLVEGHEKAKALIGGTP
jgi:hypothetical protein